MSTPDRTLAVDLMAKLGFQPDPWQIEVLEMNHPRLLLNCCRQAGKSTVVAFLGLFEAMTRGMTRVLLLSRSHRQSKELFRLVTFFHQLLGERGMERRTAEELELKNLSRIICLPCNEETIRGYSKVDVLVIDEAARVPDDLYRALRPMLAVSGGRLICLSTPYGKRGFFWEAWAKGGTDWARIEIPAAKVSRIESTFLEEERRALGESWFRQEYCCSFEALEGLVYPDFGRCVIKNLPASQTGERSGVKGEYRQVGGIDFGFRNPFAAIWGVVDKKGVLYLTGEHYARQKPLSYHAGLLPREVVWYADPAGAGDIAELRLAGFKVNPGRNPLRPGIAAVSARLQAGTLRVLEGRCPNLLAEAGLYRYGEDRDSEVPEDHSNHALAALRYLITRLDERRLGGHPIPEPAPTAKKPNPDEAEANRRWWERAMEDPGPGSIWVSLD